MAQNPSRRTVVLTHSPIFFAFFTWGFGTGAQHLARPLFAYALTQNAFLVALVVGLNAVPRLFTAPLTGYLADRIGRKPLVIFGSTLRGLTNLGQFYTDDYGVFLALEFIGAIGVSMWNTSSNVLLADITEPQNRGRALALRQMSIRMGFVAGPFVGGIVAAIWSIPAVFLVNGASKVVIVITVLFMVRETKPERAAVSAGGQAPAKGEGRAAVMAVVRTRSFVALAITLMGFAMAQAAVLQALLPVFVSEELGLGEGSVGQLVSLAALLAFLLAFPNGIVSDRYGRKVSLVPGLFAMSGAAALLMVADSYALALLAVAIQGSGEGMTMGTTHTYAMDLAPRDQRGSFLGVAHFFQAIGALLGPLLIGALYHGFNPQLAFAVLAVWLAVAALSMGLLAKETAGPRAVDLRQVAPSLGD